MEMLQTAEFWIGLMKIIWINIILSGDNAVVIALAARSLPPHQQKPVTTYTPANGSVVTRQTTTWTDLSGGTIQQECRRFMKTRILDTMR